MRRITLVVLVFQLASALAWGADAASGLDVGYYTKLRMDYAGRSDYSPGWDLNDDRKAVIDAYKKEDYDRTNELATAWLKQVPVDAEIYLVQALSLKAKGDLSGYTRGMAHFYGLLSSITSSGDGSSAKSAFKVISVSEEYFLLRDIGAKLKKQSLVNGCDVMVVDQRGKEMTYYFDVTISLAAQKRMLGL
jgi:hypothetical protein